MTYLDHAATTPLDPQVLEAMMPYFTECYGNASALYRQGQLAREALDDARLTISQHLECSLDEIYFTSGATESNNLAIKGVIDSYHQNKNNTQTPHVITTNIEHSAVKTLLEELQADRKVEVSFIEVNQEGIVDPENIKAAFRENTILVSCMAVNNEIGSVQPISRIGRMCRKAEIPFHIDAVQALGQIPVSCEAWKADMLSLSAHKFYGPKGIGMLFVRNGTELCAQIIGGGQERSYRAGTENIAGVVGMEKALQLAVENQVAESSRLLELQIFAKQYLEKYLPFMLWNGPEVGDINIRVPSNLNFCVSQIDGESVLMRLDIEGIAISLGSACSAGMMKPSHVLLALGRDESEAKSGLRLTMGKGTTQKGLSSALEKIVEVVLKLREEREFF